MIEKKALEEDALVFTNLMMTPDPNTRWTKLSVQVESRVERSELELLAAAGAALLRYANEKMAEERTGIPRSRALDALSGLFRWPYAK